MISIRQPSLRSMFSAIFAVAALAAPEVAAQQGAADIALEPAVEHVEGVSPFDGTAVPINAQIVFTSLQNNGEDIGGNLFYPGDIDPTDLNTSSVHCTDRCLGVVDDLVLRPGQAELTLGTNLEQSLTVHLNVLEAEDTTPPTLETGPTLTSFYAAYQGEHLGYDVEVSLPEASDDYGIGYYEVYAGTDAEEGLAHTNTRLGDETGGRSAWTFIDASAQQACARVTAFDLAGHSVSSERVCVDNVPPTSEQLAESVYVGGCFGGAEPVAPGLGLLGLLGLGRLARRRRR